MDLNTKVRRNPRVVARELAEGEGAVLLHLDSGAYHRVNQIGRMIWDLMEAERTVEDLVAGVRDQVTGAPLQIDQDIKAFLEGAADRDLIRIIE